MSFSITSGLAHFQSKSTDRFTRNRDAVSVQELNVDVLRIIILLIAFANPKFV